MIKYKWKASELTDYSIDSGWKYKDSTSLYSQDFYDIEECRDYKNNFIEECNTEFTAYQLDILILNYEDNDINWCDLDIIDNSEQFYRGEYSVQQYFRQYMIPQSKFRIDNLSFDLTRNEACKRTENSSFKWHIIELFRSEEEAQKFIDEQYIV